MCRHKKAESPSKPATALKILEDVEDERDLMMFTPAAAGIEADADAVSSPGGPAGCGRDSAKLFASGGSRQCFCSSSAINHCWHQRDAIANVGCGQEIATLAVTCGRQHESSEELGK